jgi:hypothetical protein
MWANQTVQQQSGPTEEAAGRWLSQEEAAVSHLAASAWCSQDPWITPGGVSSGDGGWIWNLTGEAKLNRQISEFSLHFLKLLQEGDRELLRVSKAKSTAKVGDLCWDLGMWNHCWWNWVASSKHGLWEAKENGCSIWFEILQSSWRAWMETLPLIDFWYGDHVPQWIVWSLQFIMGGWRLCRPGAAQDAWYPEDRGGIKASKDQPHQHWVNPCSAGDCMSQWVREAGDFRPLQWK